MYRNSELTKDVLNEKQYCDACSIVMNNFEVGVSKFDCTRGAINEKVMKCLLH